MGYRLKKGVVIFEVCGGGFIFPSRAAQTLVQAILPVSEELRDVIFKEHTSKEKMPSLSPEMEQRLKRLAKAGYIEEY